jgi:hypothetical protein
MHTMFFNRRVRDGQNFSIACTYLLSHVTMLAWFSFANEDWNGEKDKIGQTKYRHHGASKIKCDFSINTSPIYRTSKETYEDIGHNNGHLFGGQKQIKKIWMEISSMYKSNVILSTHGWSNDVSQNICVSPIYASKKIRF